MSNIGNDLVGAGGKGAAGQQTRVGVAVLIGIIVGYVALAFLVKAFAPAAGWSEFDSRLAHFPVINYFITNGYDLGYPPYLAMLPGMHVMFAAAAQIFGLGTLEHTGWPAFYIATVFGVLFAVMVVAVWWIATGRDTAKAYLLVPLLCSSYPLYSWLWPTTDIGAFSFYLGMLLILLMRPANSTLAMLVYGVLVVLAASFRQNYAALAAGPLACAVVVYFWSAVEGRATSVGRAAVVALPTILPIVAAATVVVAMVAIWGGLVPPELQRHGARGQLQLVPIAHIFAIAGTVAAPFALPFGRRLWAHGLLVQIVAASILVAALCFVLLPLNFDESAGRYGSIVWTVSARLNAVVTGAGNLAVSAMIAAGAFVLLGSLIEAWKSRGAVPELVMFWIFATTFLVQAMSWQRYVEFPVLATLSVQLASQGNVNRFDKALIVVWFAVYGLLSVGRAFLGAAAA